MKDDAAGLRAFVEDRENLVRLARSYVQSAAIAEELVQDSWLRWHGRRYPERDAQFIFRRIVANLARDWWRRQKTERAVVDALSLAQDTVPNAERVVIARQDLARVVEALENLPPRTQYAFELSWHDGLSFAEIGKHLGVSKTRAYKMVGRALTELALSLDV
ncbi:MAG: RNA polymerase sigma factor [Pseudomonadota bacterium]